MQYRKATPADSPRILEIIRQAQAQMRALGSSQWQDGYPAREDIEADIARGCGIVACTDTDGPKPGTEFSCIPAGTIVAYAAVIFDGEPAYDAIDGAWLCEGGYVVVHRLAVADEAKKRGVATAFLREAARMGQRQGLCSFRIDTAPENRYMQQMLAASGFTCCGRIRYRSGERLAYEKPLSEAAG